MVSLVWHIQIKTILVDSFCFNILWLLSGTSNWSQLAIQAGLVKNLTFEQWHILDILWKKKWKKTHVGCAVLLLPAVNRAALVATRDSTATIVTNYISTFYLSFNKVAFGYQLFFIFWNCHKCYYQKCHCIHKNYACKT